jgi:hypothetical protein
MHEQRGSDESMRGFFRLSIAFVVWGALGAALTIKTDAQSPAVGSKDRIPAHVGAGWQTYRSPDYGFSISYPKNVTFYGSHPDPAEMKSSYSPICVVTTVACFEYSGSEYEGTNLEAAGLSVNVLREMRTERDCNDIDTGSAAIKAEIINGINFHYGIVAGVGAGHWEGGPSYRAFYQNVCFEIAVGIAETNIGVYEPGAIKSFDSRKVDALLNEMVHTFRFTGDVADGPAWKVHTDSGCGGSYEYPEGDTVITTIEYSQDGFYSNDVTCSQYFSDSGRNYTVAAKVNLANVKQFDAWLKAWGYPDLSKAQTVTKSSSWTEYYAEPYYYVFGQGDAFILSVSDSKHRVMAPSGDRVFSHLMNTFKMP